MLKLPDFRNAATYEEIAALFERAARTIMLEHDLVVGLPEQRRMHITSLELYLHSNAWPDPNCDCNPEQRQSGTWYVKRNGYNANRSRIDITCGNVSEGLFGGMLIRALDGVDGSGKAIKQIMRGVPDTPLKWNDQEIDILTNEVSGKPIFENWLRLMPAAVSRSSTIQLLMRQNCAVTEEPWSRALRAVVVAE